MPAAWPVRRGGFTAADLPVVAGAPASTGDGRLCRHVARSCRGLQRGGLGGELLALMPDAEAAIQMLAHLDAAAGVGAVSPRRQQLEPVLIETHRVIPAHVRT